LDQSNVKRFLRKMGVVSSRQELVGVLRRFDLDGDCKVNLKEFEAGMKSSLSVFGKSAKNVKSFSKMQSMLTRNSLGKSVSTERLKSARKVRPLSSSSRVANTRRRETELRKANSKNTIGPNSNYFIN